MADQLTPSVYATLMDRATAGPAEVVTGHIKSRLERTAEQLAAGMAEELRAAYVAGVADGFAQGVAAEAERAAAPTPASGGNRG